MIDSSPPPLPVQDPISYDDASGHNDDDRLNDENQRGHGGHERDFIIDEDEDDGAVQQSSPLAMESDRKEDDVNDDEERHAKRRRISISSPEVEVKESPSSLAEAEDEWDAEMQDAASVIESLDPEPATSDNEVGSDVGVIQEATEKTGESSPDHEGRLLARALQPTFQEAPRFKPAELPEGATPPEPLPDAFSPRRKGAKYVNGGLAAELRDWLIDVEAGFSSGLAAGSAARNEEWVARIQVNELRATYPSAQGMKLVLGRQVVSNPPNANKTTGNSQTRDGNEEATEILGNSTFRLILAGPGRLSGLGVGNDGRPGVILGIGRPTWEVIVDGLGRWGVACDWAVLR